jgi:DNA-binding response OmpR family regulator
MADGARHVLLIEDEANIAEAIRFILSRAGLRVTALADGAEALAWLEGERPDLIILDLMLPGASGLDVLARVRGEARLAATPVLMLTAKGQGRDREAAERAGANRFMTKPFANADMLAEVRALIGG